LGFHRVQDRYLGSYRVWDGARTGKGEEEETILWSGEEGGEQEEDEEDRIMEE
jgi:hypothetical protein